MEYGGSALNAIGFAVMSWLFRQGVLDIASAHPFGLYGFKRFRALACLYLHYIFAVVAVVFLLDSVLGLGLGAWRPFHGKQPG